jgi:predicted metal-dependent enzyme (double-stranded beta helix superfamily)
MTAGNGSCDRMRPMFDLERFIEECRAAVARDEAPKAIRDLVARAVADPGGILKALGEPARGGVKRLYHAPDLTIINPVWPARMTLMPHNHHMWAVIGVYTGREDNIFWRRRKGDPTGPIESATARSLGPRDAVPLGRDIIHSVTNPTGLFTSAIHVYGGDFFAAHRSEWEPEGLSERAYDVEKNMRLFEEYRS